MRFWQSVRYKLLIGFCLVMAPMIAFIVYNNLYAIRVVEDQISSHYNSLLTEYVRNNDKSLLDYYHYLINLELNPSIQNMLVLPTNDDGYTLEKIKLKERLLVDSIFYSSLIDTFFVYPNKAEELIYAVQYTYNSLAKIEKLRQWARDTVPKGVPDKDRLWRLMRIGDEMFLLKTHDMGNETISGALVQAESLRKVLHNFDIGPDGAAFLTDADGEVLVDSAFAHLQDQAFRDKIKGRTGIVTGVKHGGDSYLLLSQRSQYADVYYMVVMKESYILRNLPFFQTLINFWIPISAVVILSIYLLFLQRVMFKPLVRIIRGMNRLGQGQFDYRLPAVVDSNEFAFMTNTFNKMAEQISSLKIDVYEEQIRLQQAEYKQLQIQINPHFYMNSLNIIYNLAALKDYKTVQKLSLHLAEYFRFLMLGHRTIVRLEDEIRHIVHYLEIQKMRFVNKLVYEIDVAPHHLPWEVSPLILQPFVENCILHGFGGRTQDGTPFRIVIHSENEAGHCLKLTIRDNGPGFPPQLLDDMNAGVLTDRSGGQHLGIWNVTRRFNMLYGDSGAITFANAADGGAIVTMKLPSDRARTFDGEQSSAG